MLLQLKCCVFESITRKISKKLLEISEDYLPHYKGQLKNANILMKKDQSPQVANLMSTRYYILSYYNVTQNTTHNILLSKSFTYVICCEVTTVCMSSDWTCQLLLPTLHYVENTNNFFQKTNHYIRITFLES